MEGLTFVKVRALMTSRSVDALHFIPLLTGTQVLGLVGGYSGFWMGVAIVVGGHRKREGRLRLLPPTCSRKAPQG
ncbi:hypothetical protein MRX96_059742 [Rhipicephalus microplus]